MGTYFLNDINIVACICLKNILYLRYEWLVGGTQLYLNAFEFIFYLM